MGLTESEEPMLLVGQPVGSHVLLSMLCKPKTFAHQEQVPAMHIYLLSSCLQACLF